MFELGLGVDHVESKMITAIVDVRRGTDEHGDFEDADIVSVDADQSFDDDHRSEYDWFMDDHWIYAGSDCFWPDGLPEDGLYRIQFRIKGWWSPSTPDGPAEYDEELEIYSIEPMKREDLIGEIQRLVGQIHRMTLENDCYIVEHEMKNSEELRERLKGVVTRVLKEELKRANIIPQEPEIDVSVEQDDKDATVFHFNFVAKNDAGRALLGKMLERK